MAQDFDTIMTGITSKLTGDPKHDIPFLKKQIEIHKDDEYGQEIGRACGRLITAALPEDVRAEIFGSLEKITEGTRQAVEEARFQIYKKDYQKAVDILTPVIRKFEASGFFKDDRVTEYKSFGSMIEFVLFAVMYRDRDKEAKDLGPDYYTMYMTLASALFDLERHEEAINALEKARAFNPINPDLCYELATNYAKTDLEKYAEYSRLGLKHSYTRENLARGLRNLGYYYSDREVYDAAAACYIMSLEYDKDSRYAQSELYYIQQKSGRPAPQFSNESMEKMSEEYDFPMGPSEDVVAILYNFGKKSLEDKEYVAARILLGTLYSMIPANEIKQLLERIPEESD